MQHYSQLIVCHNTAMKKKRSVREMGFNIEQDVSLQR